MEEVSEIWGARISETLNVIGESGIVEEQETTEAPYSEQGEEKDESIVKESRSGWWDKIKRLIGFGPPRVNKKDESKTIEPGTTISKETGTTSVEEEAKEEEAKEEDRHDALVQALILAEQ